MLRVADLIACPPSSPFPNADTSDLAAIRESFVLTGETADICSRVLRRLASFPSPQRGAFLFAGNPGVGKTYLLRLMELLLADPEEPLWTRLQDGLAGSSRPARSLRTLRFNIPLDPGQDLARCLISSLTGSAAGVGTAGVVEHPQADLLTQITEIAPTLATGSLGLVALENISARVDSCGDPGQFEEELAILKNLSEVLAHNGILVLLVVDERHIRPERGKAATVPLEKLAQSCDFLWLGRKNVADIICSRIAPRNAQQRGEIEKIAAQLRGNCPPIDLKGISFAEIYPIHPQTFSAMFALRRILPSFSPLSFVHEAVVAALPRPADQLITLDDLCTYAHSTCCYSPVGDETGKEDFVSAISAVLRSVSPESFQTSSRRVEFEVPARLHGQAKDESQALEWAAILSGIEEIRVLDLPAAAARVKEWAGISFESEIRLLSKGLHPLPDALLTTRFQKEVLQFERYLELVSPVIRKLSSDSSDLRETMECIRGHFNDDPGQFTAWKTLMESLSATVRWLPSFLRCREYVCSSFPLSREELDSLRKRLLDRIHQPHLLLNPAERDSFERMFLDYKSGYVRHYCSLHQEALQIVGAAEKQTSKVDATALRNLELLSNLRHSNQIYLHRVRIIGKWLQHNQCDLPVAEILEQYPRCYCNFNPDGDRHLTRAAEQINSVVQEGLEYFRDVLRQRKRIIIEELRLLRVDETHSKPIAAILSGSSLIPLNSRSMEILNRIVEKHSSEFLAAIQSTRS